MLITPPSFFIVDQIQAPEEAYKNNSRGKLVNSPVAIYVPKEYLTI
jgi:hypothetical protein